MPESPDSRDDHPGLDAPRDAETDDDEDVNELAHRIVEDATREDE